jgi:hypothetical protein
MFNPETQEPAVFFSHANARFFSPSTPDLVSFIQSLFQSFPKNRTTELKETIVLNHLLDAQSVIEQHGQLAKRDLTFPKDWSVEQKIQAYISLRQEYYASPVLTAHPTEVLSDVAQDIIQAIIRKCLAYKTIQSRELEGEIHHLISEFVAMPLLPALNLTPEDEMKRQDRLYLDMMESWSKFNRENIASFARHLGVNVAEVKDRLTEANKYSYQNVSSWAVADIDGNKKRTRKTMENMESGLQISIIERYLSKLEPLIEKVPALQSTCDYLKRCRVAIRDGIYFNLKGSEVAKKRLVTFLETIISEQSLERGIVQALNEFRDYVDIVGFRGELKQFMRQSSQANSEVFQNFILILKDHFPEVSAMHASAGEYSKWSLENKSRLHHLMRVDSSYFRVLKEHASLLTKDTLRELDILDFVIEYQAQFSYILSDTENYHSLDNVIILFGFAAFLHRKLYIDDIRRPPVNLIPLCETPDDLANLVHILDAMLSNPYLKEVLIEKRQLTYVAGPSDLGKEGGIFSHIELIEAEKNAWKILHKHQQSDPRLSSVKLRVLYGLGCDAHRRVSKSSSQLFCTFQGSDACALAAMGGYQAYVEQVTGQCSENTARAKELGIIEEQNPEAYHVLKELVSLAIRGYREYTFHPSSLELFRKLTIPYQLGILTNTSSRGESKGSAPKDIVKSRAIGIANYDVASLCMVRLFMSANGLVDLPKEMRAHLPYLYQHSSVLKEQVLKVLFSIAVIQESIVLNKIFKHPPTLDELQHLADEFSARGEESAKNPAYALAYILSRLPRILYAMIGFLPELTQTKAYAFLDANKGQTISSLAIGLIECIGQDDELFLNLHQEIVSNLLPRYHRLASTMQAYYEAAPMLTEQEMNQLEENVVLALRGDRCLTAGPKIISTFLCSREQGLDLVKSVKLGLQ